MIVNNRLAPLTEKITNLYWAEETHVGRINVIVQYILEHVAAEQVRAADLAICTCETPVFLDGWKICGRCSLPLASR